MKDDDTTEELVACDGKATQRNIDIRNVALNVVESAGSAATNILDAVNGVARSVPKISDVAANIAVKAEDAVAVLNSPEQVQTLLDACYQAALDGIPKVEQLGRYPCGRVSGQIRNDSGGGKEADLKSVDQVLHFGLFIRGRRCVNAACNCGCRIGEYR